MSAFGIESALRIARQSSAGGVVSAPASFFSVPFISETLTVDIPPLVSDTIRARYEEGPVSQGLLTAGGDVNFRIHPITAGIFLRGWCGQASSTAVGSAFQHIFLPVQTGYATDVAVNPYTIEIYRGVDEAHWFHDACLNRLTLEIAPGQFGRGTATWLIRTHSAAAQSSGSFPGGDEFTWNQASVSLGGAASTIVEGVTFTFDNALEASPALDGTKVARRIQRNGFRTVRVSGTLDFPSNDEFDKFRAGTEQTLDVTLRSGVTVSSGYLESLRIEVPTFRYDAYPLGVSGPNRITVAFTGRGVYNTGSAAICRLTLVNTQAAY